MQVWSMATHTSILSWRIPWTEESGRLQSIELQGIRHNWSNLEHMHIVYYSAWAAIKKKKKKKKGYQRLGALNNRYLFSHSSGGKKSTTKVQHVQTLVRILFLVSRQLVSCCVHTMPLSGGHMMEREGASKISGVSSHKGTNPNMKAPPSWP